MAANRSKLQRKTNMLSVYNAFGRNFRLYPCCLSLSSNILTKVILCPLYIHNLSSPKSYFVLVFFLCKFGSIVCLCLISTFVERGFERNYWMAFINNIKLGMDRVLDARRSPKTQNWQIYWWY